MVDNERDCPVCFEAFQSTDVEYDNALACSNGHWVCVTCVARLVTVTQCTDAECTGFAYTCPVCRHAACVSRLHMLVLLKQSWSAARPFTRCPDLYDTDDTASTDDNGPFSITDSELEMLLREDESHESQDMNAAALRV